ncbi:hypothetical protein ACHAW5_011054 [Stephanodiscus triporus]|uniref:GPR180/TMEM145 transmembrane domain-containing protein n=1 Tax=Stephanodiscus triporus TaxID=2934178 RepID=A0ABD3NKI8_9STRA
MTKTSSSSFLRLLSAGPVVVVLLLLLGCMGGLAHAKVQSGRVHLSGARTESTLVKFAVPASSRVEFEVNVTSIGMYVNERELRVRAYVDDDWPIVRREALCREKVRHALRSVPVVFDYVGGGGGGRGDAAIGDNARGGETYVARIRTEIDNPPPPRPNYREKGGRPSPRNDRPRYYYFVIDDCSLEEAYGDDKVPDVFYSAMVRHGRRRRGGDEDDGGSNIDGDIAYEHLPADEDGIRALLFLTIAFSGTLFVVLLSSAARTTAMAGGGGGEVHVAILVVMAACATNGLSASCELLHMEAYRRNGYGNYSLDALSSHFEAMSDSMVSLVLLSIGGGWTLPSDVAGVTGGGGSGILVGGTKNDGTDNEFMRGIRNPAGSFLDLIHGDWRGGIVPLSIVLAHAVLAQWGRTFDDDFDTYHALEHPPGKALMVLRFALGLVFVAGVGAVRSGKRGGRCPPSLMSFLTKFGLVGLSYYASLPGISMFVGSALPYHRRHQALHWGAALVQACSLASLTWLFVGGSDASAYHRLSRVGKRRGVDGADMAEAISMSQQQQTHNMMGSVGSGGGRPKMWRLGKTKIRLD